MFTPRKRTTTPGATKSSTPLDRKQEALRAKEEQLKNAAAELQRLIDEAPRLREEQTRRRREVLAADPRLTNRARPQLHRHNSIVADPAMLEAQRTSSHRSGIIKFVLLSLALVALIFGVAKLAMTNLG